MINQSVLGTRGWRLSEHQNRMAGFLDAANRCNERATTLEKYGYEPCFHGTDDYRDLANSVSGCYS